MKPAWGYVTNRGGEGPARGDEALRVPLSRNVSNRTDLDGAVLCARDSRRDLNGIVEVLRLDEIEAAELFLRFRERSVGRGDLAIANSNGGRGLRGLERFAAEPVAALSGVVGELHVLAAHGIELFLREVRALGFLVVDEAE